MRGERNAYLHEILCRFGEGANQIHTDFGSEEFKYKLLSMFDGEENSGDILILLNIVVLKHTFNRISKGFKEGELYDFDHKKSKALYTDCISAQDSYEIASDVYCEVVKRLDVFINNIIEKGFDERARQAWLRKIIYCQCARYLNKVGRLDYIIDTDEENDEIAYIPQSNFKSPEYIAVCNDIIRETITIVCNAPFKIEKILGYLYNVIIFKEIENREKNSSSIKTCEYMNGKVMFVLKENFVTGFNKMYSVELSYKDIDSLCAQLGYNSATLKGKELFNATPKLITDWSNRMKTYVYKHKKNS